MKLRAETEIWFWLNTKFSSSYRRLKRCLQKSSPAISNNIQPFDTLLWVELYVIELSKQKSLRLTNQMSYMNLARSCCKFFQILFITVRKATTWFTHKNLFWSHNGVFESFRGRHKSKANFQTASLSRIPDDTIVEWKLAKFANVLWSRSHPRKIIERLRLLDIKEGFVQNKLRTSVSLLTP